MSERTTDERLDQVIRELESTGGAIELLDSEWRLIWVSDELKQLAIGSGRPSTQRRPGWPHAARPMPSTHLDR